MSKKKKSEDADFTPAIKTEFKFRDKGFNFSALQQQILAAMLSDSEIVFLSGMAGTSKTYLAVYAALQILKSDKSKRFIYIRSIDESARKSLGSLPGEKDDKFAPFTRPLLDKMHEIVTADTVTNLRGENAFEAAPINYLRGGQFDNTVMVIDEAQNFTAKELMTAMTRIGKGSQIFICGDTMQSDIKSDDFGKVVEKFSTQESEDLGIHAFEFGPEDVVRNPLIKHIVKVLSSV